MKIVCCYWNLLHSGSINSTSFLFSFIKIVLIYNMNSEKGYQKKVNTTRHKRKKIDVSRCIICQCQSDTTVTSTKNGERKIVEAAAVRKDQVLDRLDLVENNFVLMHITKFTLCAKLCNPFKNQMYQINISMW